MPLQLIKRDHTKKKIMVEHPETGELVFWKGLSVIDKKMVMRLYFKEAFDEAFNDIIFSLQNPDGNVEEGDVLRFAQDIGAAFIADLSGFDKTKSTNTDRNGYSTLLKTSSIMSPCFAENKTGRPRAKNPNHAQ